MACVLNHTQLRIRCQQLHGLVVRHAGQLSCLQLSNSVGSRSALRAGLASSRVSSLFCWRAKRSAVLGSNMVRMHHALDPFGTHGTNVLLACPVKQRHPADFFGVARSAWLTGQVTGVHQYDFSTRSGARRATSSATRPPFKWQANTKLAGVAASAISAMAVMLSASP